MWSLSNIHRLIIDMSLKVKGESFTGSADAYHVKSGDWKDDFGLDSIQLMELAATVNSFFLLFELENPPYLISIPRIEDWVLQIYNVRNNSQHEICFQTSGSTGSSKSIRHSIFLLEREINFLAENFKEIKTIIPLVPSYSIFGFLFTIWLPEKLKAKVSYPSEINWSETTASSLIIATPFQWKYLLNSEPSKSIHSLGVSSGAPLYNDIFQAILEKGILLTEVYGSTETLGVAYKNHWKDPFFLFPYWQLMYEGMDSAIVDRDNQKIIPLMDIIEQYDENKFVLIGRKDQKLKIAGVLVDTEYISTVIKGISNVQACSINVKSVNFEVLMEASITLINDTPEARLEFKHKLKHTLTAPEMPREIHFNIP